MSADKAQSEPNNVGYPGQNLVEVIKWFNENKGRLDGMIAWFEANKDTIANLMTKIDHILGMLKVLYAQQAGT